MTPTEKQNFTCFLWEVERDGWNTCPENRKDENRIYSWFSEAILSALHYMRAMFWFVLRSDGSQGTATTFILVLDKS